MQRIAGLRHVQLRERAPGAADGVEGAALAALAAASTSASALLTIFSAFLIDLPERSCSASPPSGSVMPGLMRLPCTSTSSSEPPPRSPTMPSGRWKPETTPSAVSSASRWPEITSILVRQMRSAAAMKALPLRASRQAAVASTHSRSTRMVSHSARKRLQRAERLLDRVGGEQALGLHLAAEAGQRLFVEERRRAAGHALVDDEADRVRADVDDRDRRAVVEPALRRCCRRWRASQARSARRREAAGRRFLERFATAGQARVGHEILVRVERLFARRRP